jgi:hypothetical protein
MATATKTINKRITKTKVTDKQLQAVLDLIESGKSERAACKEIGLNRATFRSAALRYETADHYARALEALAADQIEKMEQTIDDMRAGVVDSNMARVELDARKWFASKLLPKKYGDKLDHTSGGKELPAPILNVMITPNATNDIKREFIEAEVPKNTALDQPTSNSNIMDELND